MAIREDDDRARGLGVRTTTVKLAAFAASVAITAMCGGVWEYYIAYRFGQNDLYLVGYAAVFLLVVLFLPRGILPSVAERARRRRTPPGQASEEPTTTRPRHVCAVGAWRAPSSRHGCSPASACSTTWCSASSGPGGGCLAIGSARPTRLAPTSCSPSSA